MRYHAILLSCAVIIAEKCLCTHFDNIDIQIIQDDKSVILVSADSMGIYMEVTDITIKNQTVSVLKTGTFEDLLKLKTIKIQECRLEEIEPGAFKNLPKLRILKLNQNRLRRLSAGVFNHLEITKLYLSGNSISTIEQTALHNIYYLEVLDLSRNRISNLHPQMFNGTNNLRQINLSFNKIQFVPENFFADAFANVIKGQHSFIDLSDNELNYINLRSLKGVYNLGKLDLKNNNLDQLGPTIFYEMDSLDVLDVENNNLKALNINVLHRLTETSEINLAANPWNCDFAKKYNTWCGKYDKMNTIDYDILKECNVL